MAIFFISMRKMIIVAVLERLPTVLLHQVRASRCCCRSARSDRISPLELSHLAVFQTLKPVLKPKIIVLKQVSGKERNRRQQRTDHIDKCVETTKLVENEIYK